MPGIVKKVNLQTRILDIVFASERSVPAHYNATRTRTQTFGVEFPIPEEDETELASEAYYAAPGYLDSKRKELLANPHFSMVLKIGEDIMIGSYIAARFEIEIPEIDFIRSITDRNLYLWGSHPAGHGLRRILARRKIADYFFHCLRFGYSLAYAEIEAEIESSL